MYYKWRFFMNTIFSKVKAIFAVLILIFCFNFFYSQELIQFVFTSDPHYGLTRTKFQGSEKVDAHIVNAAMIAKINTIQGLTLPKDGGIKYGKIIGAIDFIVEAGEHFKP